jgi:TolB protein
MDVDGRGQRRITDKEGYEMNPAVSPDGVHLAFAGDRASRGLDILLLSLTAPGDEKLLVARRSQDSSPAFSPDGKSVAFIATSDGHPEIYFMNTDGTGLVRLTHSTDEKAGPQFSVDGRRIVFSSNRRGRFALYQIDAH